MLCPNCSRSMPVKKQDLSYGSGKTYDRVQYICSSCDIWVLVETPQEQEET